MHLFGVQKQLQNGELRLDDEKNEGGARSTLVQNLTACDSGFFVYSGIHPDIVAQKSQ